MGKKKQKESVKQSKLPQGGEILIPLEVIKKAYIESRGFITVAAALCNIGVRQYKNYLYVHYKKEMAEVIEETIEGRADELMDVYDKILVMVRRKAELSIEIMAAPPELRKMENFDLLKTLNIREMQYIVLMIQLYAKHRGFNQMYSAGDFGVVTEDNKPEFAEEELQIVGESLKEAGKRNPELLRQLRVIKGGKE